MASKEYSALNIQTEDDELNLQFQDFGDTKTVSYEAGASDFPQEYNGDDSEEKLLGESDQRPNYSFWTLGFYQQYFNVDQKQVGDRIKWSMIPKPGVYYLQSYIRPNPDLYGPFWISITLIFSVAVMGNLASYFQSHGSYHWKYNYHKVSLAATTIFSYVLFVPLFIWGIIFWKGSKATLSMLELICIYGYSLSVFVPVSILWVVPLPWFQWCVGIVSAVLSGSVLVKTILPSIAGDVKKLGVAVAIMILIIHSALALSFMIYFFHDSNQYDAPDFVPPSPAPIVTTKLPVASEKTKRDDPNMIHGIPVNVNKNPSSTIKTENASNSNSTGSSKTVPSTVINTSNVVTNGSKVVTNGSKINSIPTSRDKETSIKTTLSKPKEKLPLTTKKSTSSIPITSKNSTNKQVPKTIVVLPTKS